MSQGQPPALEVRHLSVDYFRRGQPQRALDGVGVTVAAGEAYGLVGESGCGKSTLALAVMHYLPRSARIADGSIHLAGTEISTLSRSQMRPLWGRRLAMVSQDPAAALNPSMRIGSQVTEAVRADGRLAWTDARDRVGDLLDQVALASVPGLLDRYPHQLSGGQQQRVLIAMALARDPALLVLDEPTTGLDATIEAEIVEVVAELRRRRSTAIVFISHDLSLVARTCSQMAVLYGGRVVEEGATASILARPRHPYTESLLRCVPRPDSHRHRRPLSPIPGPGPESAHGSAGCNFASRCLLADEECRSARPPLVEAAAGHYSACRHAHRTQELPRSDTPVAPPALRQQAAAPILEIRGLTKRYGETTACEHVDLVVRRGETLGLVGESGSGKSTLARCIAGLVVPDEGELRLNGEFLPPVPERRTEAQLRAVQMVFQQPDSTLNPRHSLRRILDRAITKLGGGASSEELANSAQLDPSLLAERPPRLSGGQKQRAAIARALAGDPKLVVCDEPLSALDVSVQAGILNLLGDLQERAGVAYVFISHDLAVVRYLADRIAVMYRGHIVEQGDADAIFSGPRHPYTDLLISAAQDERPPPEVEPADTPADPAASTGCPFVHRCRFAISDVCASQPPPLRRDSAGHVIRCHLPVTALPGQGDPEPSAIRA